jgi:hypothetical protein
MPDYFSMADLFIIPAGAGTEGYVELGSRGATGTVFRKHILNLGPLHYDGKTYELGEQFYDQLKRNFDAGVSMVQASVADANNKHSEDPLRNGGEVIGLERDGSKVYTIIDVRNQDVVKGLRDKTIMGASAFVSMNYEDSRSAQKVGPALLHHCFTNRPHVLDLDPYEEIVAATAYSADMDFDQPIMLSTEDELVELSKEELLEQLRARFGVDVAQLELAASARADITAITDALKNAGTLSLTGETLSQSDVVGAIVELNARNLSLSDDVAKLTRKDAERTVQGYVDAGRLLPKSAEQAVEMLLSRPQDLDAFLAPVDTPYIAMNAQTGVTGEGADVVKHNFDVGTEIGRLAELSASLGGHSRRNGSAK